MKKFTFSTILLLSFLLVQAQDNINAVYKQVNGSNTFEVNFNPGSIFSSISDNPSDLFSLFDWGIKYRKFISANKALRFGINIPFYSNVEITQQADPNNNKLELKDKSSNFSIILLPGLEKHFTDLKRLSPYIGVQGLIGYSMSIYKSEYQSNNSVYVEKWVNSSNYGDYGSFDIGLGVLAGFDYYFVKKLYLGVEFGYGLQYSKFLNTKYSDEKDSSSDYNNKNGSSFSASAALSTGNLRLGWAF